MALTSRFLDWVTFSSLPPAVIHWKPEKMVKAKKIAPTRPKTMAIKPPTVVFKKVSVPTSVLTPAWLAMVPKELVRPMSWAKTGVVPIRNVIKIKKVMAMILVIFLNSKFKSKNSKLQLKIQKFLVLDYSFAFWVLSFELFYPLINVVLINQVIK